MKICLITSYLPGLSSGSAVRNLHLLKNLAKSNEVVLLSGNNLSNAKAFEEYKKTMFANVYLFSFPTFTLKDRIQKYIQNKIPYVERLKQSSIHKVLNRIPKDVDIIQIAELQSYSIIEPYLYKLPGIKVLDAHNIDYLRIKSEFDSSPLLRKIAGFPVYQNLKRYEINAIKKVDYILTCSDIDRNIYAQYKPEDRIKVIPNGVDIKAFKGSKGAIRKHSVLFMGLLSYSPNEYGIHWFINYVHPQLKEFSSDYRLIITGNGAPKWLVDMANQDPRIELMGFVPDIQSVISSAHACICPIFAGSGTRLKLLEYMAMNKAIVSTTRGAEGIDIQHNKHLLIADNAQEFIEAMKKLFINTPLRESLQKNAKALIHEKYNWEKIGDTLNKLYKSL